MALPLITHSELCWPASFGGHKPDIVAPADVGDEGHLFVVRRPFAFTHKARYIKLFYAQRLNVQLAFGGDLAGISNELMR